MTTIPFQPATPAPALVADQGTEIWNAAMWAYHESHITVAQACMAMGIPTGQFDRSYTLWHQRIFECKPTEPKSIAKHGRL